MNRHLLARAGWEALVRISWIIAAVGLLVTAVETGMLIDGSLGAWS